MKYNDTQITLRFTNTVTHPHSLGNWMQWAILKWIVERLVLRSIMIASAVRFCFIHSWLTLNQTEKENLNLCQNDISVISPIRPELFGHCLVEYKGILSGVAEKVRELCVSNIRGLFITCTGISIWGLDRRSLIFIVCVLFYPGPLIIFFWSLLTFHYFVWSFVTCMEFWHTLLCFPLAVRSLFAFLVCYMLHVLRKLQNFDVITSRCHWISYWINLKLIFRII